MTMWMVRYIGKVVPVTFEAETFIEVVLKAMVYAKENNLGDDPILSISYLSY